MYNEMRQLQYKERNSSLLQKVNPDFYKRMGKYVSEETELRLARSKKVVFDDIKRVRFHKIVHKAMSNIEIGDNSELAHMTNDEKKLFDKCMKLFEEWWNETQ